MCSIKESECGWLFYSGIKVACKNYDRNVFLLHLIFSHLNLRALLEYTYQVRLNYHSLNTPSKAILVPSNRFEYLECLAVINSINKNIIDSEQDKIGGLDVLAQHILGVACSKPFDPNILFINIKKAWPYRHLKKKEYLSVLEFVKNGGYTLKKYEKFSKIGLNKDNLYMVKNKSIINSYKLNIGTIVES